MRIILSVVVLSLALDTTTTLFARANGASASFLVPFTPRRPGPRRRVSVSLNEVSSSREVRTNGNANSLQSRNRIVLLEPDRPDRRFDRTASDQSSIEAPCILTIDGVQYNMTAWANSHPGGSAILQKFHGKDATRAFHAVGHSEAAYKMLKRFAIDSPPPMQAESSPQVDSTSVTPVAPEEARAQENEMDSKSSVPRWRRKLFTHEDPRGIHKSLGIYCLLHFLYRFRQMYFGDPSAGLGNRLGSGPSVWALCTIVPHAALSLSSLIFHTVPRERVVGKPMIWQEFRAHNILFGVRSIICTALCWMSIATAHGSASTLFRRVAVAGSVVTVLGAQVAADVATHFLRENDRESTTATMPYWQGCSMGTQRMFKQFYAYCQFMATMACLYCSNPAWPLACLLPIQLASLLMTLVRKGLISAGAYHGAYALSLAAIYPVGFRSVLLDRNPDFLMALVASTGMYQLRRRGASKYLLWLPLLVARLFWSDKILCGMITG